MIILVTNNGVRFSGQTRFETLQFMYQIFKLTPWFRKGQINNIHEAHTPFNVFKEVYSQSSIFVSTRNEAWKICYSELDVVIKLNNSNIWIQCCKWVAGNTRSCS